MKKCGTCNNNLDDSFFYKRTASKDGLANVCKKCANDYCKNWSLVNKDKASVYYDNMKKREKIVVNKKTCVYCKEERDTSFFTPCKTSRDGFRAKCKTCRNNSIDKKTYLEKAIKYYWENREKKIEYSKKYRIENNDKYNEYRRNLYKTSPTYKAACSVRSRLRKMLKIKGFDKSLETHETIGCSYIFLVDYLQSKFIDGMNWDNYGEWHIDHIIPLSSANTEKELISLSHYTNLQPLWAKDNLEKGCKIKTPHLKAGRFLL